ncbi:MAG: DHH family phosphoesterase [Candidatus Buchananbacteria bacterium]
MNFTFDQIKDALSRAQNIIIITHQKADGDACGSALAMTHYLQSLGKNVSIFCDGGAPKYFDFLPGFHNISGDKTVLQNNWDTALFLDCGDLANSNVSKGELNGAHIINIDHHYSNDKYGKINYIDPRASSACEIINKFFLSIGFNIDKKISTCLLTGILTDTHAFTNGATSLNAIETASSMVKRGARIHISVDHYFKNKSLNSLKLWGEILSRLKINKKYSIAYTYIADDDFKKFAVKPEEADGIINFMNSLTGIKACFVVRQQELTTKISMRTNNNNIDLTMFANLFGGGGHKKAAGFTYKYPIGVDNGKLIISC